MPPRLPDLAGVRHSFLDLNGFRAHVAEAGDPDAEPVVMLHGWPQHWWCWRKVIPPLAERYRVICPDLRGHGWSDAPEGAYGKELFARDLVALLDELGLERVKLVGHDWGSMAGFLACIREPQRFDRFLALSIVPPFPAKQGPAAYLEAWRLYYQLPLTMPVIAPRLVSKPGFLEFFFKAGTQSDDAIALLDVLGIERVRVAGHDWGAFAAILAALAAPERFSSLLAMSIGHPWVPAKTAARHGYLLLYQLPLAAPFVGERVIRDGRYVRGMLRNGRRDGRHWTPEEEATYVDSARENAHASSKLYRDFVVRELRPGTYDDQRPAMPAKLLIGSREPFRDFAAGFPGEVDVIDGAGHFIPEETPQAVAERIRAM